MYEGQKLNATPVRPGEPVQFKPLELGGVFMTVKILPKLLKTKRRARPPTREEPFFQKTRHIALCFGKPIVK